MLHAFYTTDLKNVKLIEMLALEYRYKEGYAMDARCLAKIYPPGVKTEAHSPRESDLLTDENLSTLAQHDVPKEAWTQQILIPVELLQDSPMSRLWVEFVRHVIAVRSRDGKR